MTKVYPLILSGGSGTRLWPMSRALYPKQLLPLAGEHTMLQDCAIRVSDTARYHAPLVVCNQEHRFVVAEQMRAIGVEDARVVLEPVGRNTAPAIAAAALMLARDEPDALMAVFPSDHVIADRHAFDAAMGAALAAAAAGWLTTFGIVPDAPETGYGYLEPGATIDGLDDVRRLARFVEKPNRERAEAMLAQGGYSWNSGMFVLPVGLFLEELERFEPKIVAACRAAVEAGEDRGDFFWLDGETFGQSPAISIDYAVMEHTQRGALVAGDFSWSDVGSWSALWDIGDKDRAGNVVLGDVLSTASSNCYLRSESGLLAAVGVEDLVVVAMEDAVLVAHRDAAQDVKGIVERLKQASRPELSTHRRVYRPWGYYHGVDTGNRFQVNQIMVKPGARLSLQMHHHRAEHWVVVEGTAKVTCGDEEQLLHENQSTYIPLGAAHRLENPGRVPLRIVEVQSGSYLGDDDIVRLEDVYGPLTGR